MKVVVACAGHAAPHAGWAAIDELADLLVHYLGAALVSPRRAAPTLAQRLLGKGSTVWEPIACPGGDLLIVVAHAPQDLSMIDAIAGCRGKFSRIVAWVTDSYFQAGFGRATAQYDAITVTAHEDAAHPRAHFGIPVHHVYQGVDGLAWAPPPDTPLQAPRAIDLIGFGRMPPSYHAHFSQRFHPASSPHLYLHSPLGNVTGASVHLERGMMVTSRWLESLLAGCVVAGQRPVSRMADERLCWPGATVELAHDPRQAADQLQQLLARDDELQAQRRRNVHEVLLRHDWRHRIAELCGHVGLPTPAALAEDLQRVHALAGRFA